MQDTTLIPLAEAARRLGMKPDTLLKVVQNNPGLIPATKVHAKQYVVPETWLASELAREYEAAHRHLRRIAAMKEASR